MKNKCETIISTAIIASMYLYSFVNLDRISFVSGVFVGVGTVIVAVMWYDQN